MRERLVAHRILSSLLEHALGNGGGRTAPRGRRLQADGPIRFVIFDAFWMSGATRAMLNVASHMAATREIEIVSIRRSSDEPFFPFPPGAKVTVLDDDRPHVRRPLLRRLLSKLPSALVHPDDALYSWLSMGTDVALLRRLRSWRAGAVVTTRPSLGLCAARLAHRSVVVVSQEHGPVGLLPDELQADVRRRYRQLDVVAVLTGAEDEEFGRRLCGSRARVERIPNSLSPVPGEPIWPREKVILGAGRMTRAKGFDLLVEAFALIAPRHPDWKLRIHGAGPQLPALQQLVAQRGLEGSVELLPPTPRIGETMARTAIFVLCSRQEGFPLVLPEAMSKQMAIVSYDCPTGPREIITDGMDGLLVPAEDVGALSDALTRLIEDEDLRARLGAAGPEKARRYGPSEIGRQWAALLERSNVGPTAYSPPGPMGVAQGSSVDSV